MKIVTLAAPAAVNTGHPVKGYPELRHPAEGPLTVSDKEAERLKDNNLLACDPEDVPDQDTPAASDGASEDTDQVPDDLKGLKVAELKALALKEGVPLHDANTKPAIVAAFVAHRDKA